MNQHLYNAAWNTQCSQIARALLASSFFYKSIANCSIVGLCPIIFVRTNGKVKKYNFIRDGIALENWIKLFGWAVIKIIHRMAIKINFKRIDRGISLGCVEPMPGQPPKPIQSKYSTDSRRFRFILACEFWITIIKSHI